MDRLRGAKRAKEALHLAKTVVRELSPWDLELVKLESRTFSRLVVHPGEAGRSHLKESGVE